MAESHQSKQYLYDFELDRNDSEVNKVQNTLLRLVKLLPPGSKNYRIAADNLFHWTYPEVTSQDTWSIVLLHQLAVLLFARHGHGHGPGLGTRTRTRTRTPSPEPGSVSP
eukprot:3456792-Rhodomonas_salina.1